MPIVFMLHLDDMEACRLLEPVSDGKPKPCRVRALGVNFRDRFVVKLAQRVEPDRGRG